MALSSIKFRIEGDGSSAMRALNDFKKGVNDAKGISNQLGQKIQQVFKFSVVEEMTRRTAEWATELSKSAQKMQITTDELQAFQVAARKIGMDSNKIEQFFDSMEDGALAALKGNMDLIRSFSQLGITMQDLRTMKPADLFTKITSNIGKPMGMVGAQEIFGRQGALDLSTFSKFTGGASGSDLSKQFSESIAPQETILELRAAWTDLLNNMKDIAVTLAPVASLIVQIVDGLASMLKGTLNFLKRSANLSRFFVGSFFSKDINEKYEDLQAESQGMGSSFFKGIYNSFASMANIVPKIFGSDKELLSTYKRPADVSEKVWEEGQGAGGAASTFLTGGTRGFIPKGLRGKLRGKPGVVGSPGIFGIREMFRKGGLSMGYSAAEIDALLGPPSAFELGAENYAAYTQALSAGGVRGKEKTAEAMKNIPKLPDTFKRTGFPMNIGAFGGEGGGGSPSLRIGGVFGTDVSLKIMTLNQEMVNLLTQIVQIIGQEKMPMTYVNAVGLQ